MLTGKEFDFDNLSEEFVIVVRSNEKAQEVVKALENKLNNYNHKVLCLVKEDYSQEQQPSDQVDFCVTND